MKKNGLHVEHFRYHITINYDKSSSACIDYHPVAYHPVAARIKFKTLMLAYRMTTGSAPSYFHSLLRMYIQLRKLVAQVRPVGRMSLEPWECSEISMSLCFLNGSQWHEKSRKILNAQTDSCLEQAQDLMFKSHSVYVYSYAFVSS